MDVRLGHLGPLCNEFEPVHFVEVRLIQLELYWNVELVVKEGEGGIFHSASEVIIKARIHEEANYITLVTEIQSLQCL